jgi:hypothetical protein
MNIFDTFLNSISYKFPKGYPDMNDPKDIILLESLVSEVLGENINLKEASLEVSKLKNRPNRRKAIIDKIWSNSPFQLIDDKEIVITSINIDGKEYSSSNSSDKDLASTALANVNKLSFTGLIDGKSTTISASKIKKTGELGGRGEGSSTAIEATAMNNLDDTLKQLNHPIDIKIGNNIYKNIVGVKNTPGTPKSDFELFDTNGKSLIFVSHKDCCTAKDFQQYGGLSAFKDNPEVQAFVSDIKKEINGDQMVRGGGFKRKVNDQDLALKSVYGLNYGSSDFGINNVQIVCQGEIQLVPIKNNLFTLKSAHDILNGTYPTEGYTPYFMATFRSDRNDLGIKQARLGVYPVATRPSAKEI